jgi:hypothetical protein
MAKANTGVTLTPKQNFECAFYVVTGKGDWGRHVELPEALKRARIKPDEKEVQYVVSTFLFKEDTPKDTRTAILHCFCVDNFGSVRVCTGLEDDDVNRMNEYLIGYTQYSNVEWLKHFAPKQRKTLKK